MAQLTCKFRLLEVSLTAVTGSRTYAIAWQRRGHPRMGRFRSSKSGPGSDPTHLGRPHHVHRRHQGRTDHAHAHVRRSNVSNRAIQPISRLPRRALAHVSPSRPRTPRPTSLSSCGALTARAPTSSCTLRPRERLASRGLAQHALEVDSPENFERVEAAFEQLEDGHPVGLDLQG